MRVLLLIKQKNKSMQVNSILNDRYGPSSSDFSDADLGEYSGHISDSFDVNSAGSINNQLNIGAALSTDIVDQTRSSDPLQGK